ncbi:hypothetical protein ACFE04_010823 [Oxalis oulophora]
MKQFVVYFVGFLLLLEGSEATEYTVGDATGWNVPSNTSFYQQWASGKNFTTADTLVFNFATNAHNVDSVSMEAYEKCDTKGTSNLISTGPAKVALNTSGAHYFICTVGTHCSLGQKLAVNVSGTTTPSASTPTTTAGSSPSSNAPSSTALVAFSVMFLAIAINLLF